MSPQMPPMPPKVTADVWTWVDDKGIKKLLDKGLCKANRTSRDFSLVRVGAESSFIAERCYYVIDDRISLLTNLVACRVLNGMRY